ncbi:hypothetical protein SAMN05421538_11282 [Paracoccus isoporae]|uniref:DUF1993 domain-containing protein n=1 Tax=Paracoccus isoporae TaxID=591205 RepID=A0A1G7G7D5_9RHOB|nr:DUF1993 family protein [Paracoccus isoporae]SDE84030.1 hypothetical protein SAMN05421538_11282 [Paracoccus isoporae]
MTLTAEAALVRSVVHYLGQAEHLLAKLECEPEAKALLAIQLAPDSFDTGFHLAVAIQFAARALCQPVGADIPEIEEPCSLTSLRNLHSAVAEAIVKAPRPDWTVNVKHTAGEAQLEQSTADYVARFALPNMLFHLTMAYAGLRHGGVRLGKADFDGQHEY